MTAMGLTYTGTEIDVGAAALLRGVVSSSSSSLR